MIKLPKTFATIERYLVDIYGIMTICDLKRSMSRALYKRVATSLYICLKKEEMEVFEEL